MESENKAWTIVGCTFAVVLLILGVNGCIQEHKTYRKCIDNGYIQQQKIGDDGVIWVKK